MRLFTTLMLLATLCLTTTGCRKENEPANHDDPIPTEANYMVCGNDSLQISIVVVMRSAYKGDVMDWSFKLSDSQILKLYTTKNLQQEGSWPFIAESAAYNGDEGVYGVYMEGFEEEDLVGGNIEVRLVNGKPEFMLEATTESGRSVRMHYYGEIHDLSHPIGTGEITFGNESRQLDMAYAQIYYDLYEYAFSDSVSGIGVTFYSTRELTSGTLPISDDMDIVGQGEALNLYLYIEEGSSPLIGDVGNGSATCSLEGDRIEIAFNGELEGTAITGHYQGRLERLGSSILKSSRKR